MTTKAGVFISNKTQAVRLPKDVALPSSVKQVEIIPMGRARLIVPVDDSWDAWFAGEGTSEDYMENRDQPEPQKREAL